MSLGPLDRPADLQSVLPIQVLCALGGLFMVLVEGALAHWSIFHSSAPLIALCYIYFMQIAYPFRLSLLAVLFMGLFSEIMFYHMLGTNCTAFTWPIQLIEIYKCKQWFLSLFYIKTNL